jgi:transposase
VHVTETCDDKRPSLITHVETALGPVADGEATPRIHHALAQRNLLPGIDLLDTGYLDTELLIETCRQFAVDLLGPTPPDRKWQARADQGFDLAYFTIHWDHQQATCPQGHTSHS